MKLLAFLIISTTLFATDKIQKLEQACGDKNGESCFKLSRLYKSGDGVPQNIERSILFAKKGCDLKNGKACGFLSDFYRSGNGVKKDPVEAFKLLKQGCDLNSKISCYLLGRAYQKKSSIKKNSKKMLIAFLKGCHLGYEKSCQYLKHVYNRKKIIDPKKCRKSKKERCAQTGLNYQQGKNGITQNIILANEYYKAGCDFNSGRSCFHLGYNYQFGYGFKKDLRKARHHYRLACKLKSDAGCRVFRKNLLQRKRPFITFPSRR